MSINYGFNDVSTSGNFVASSGNFTTALTVNGINISLSNHNHTSSSITDFTEAVQDVIGASGFLTSGTGININYNDSANTLNISTVGLQPSGNYSLVGHTHTVSNITDFNSGVSGLLPSVSGSGYVVSAFSGNAYTISVSGVQPSGNYSLVGHTHTASNITDFNSSVSGVVNSVISTDIVAGTGVNITYDNINNDLIIGLNGLIPVVASGTLTGSNDINAGVGNSYQTITLNGTPTTFTKGTGWPIANTQATDVVLKITVSTGTSITWTIVTDWFNQPPAGVLNIGTHLILLRGVGTSVVEGHYIGSKTN